MAFSYSRPRLFRPKLISKDHAYVIAQYWASCEDRFDLGACFLRFNIGDGRPVDDHHRACCISYTSKLIDVHGDSRPELVELLKFFWYTPLYGQEPVRLSLIDRLMELARDW